MRSEQRRLHRRRADLEKAIGSDWKAIRKTVEPAGLLKEALSSCTTWLCRQVLSRLRTGKGMRASAK